jgi:hypothetical protein
LGKVEAKGKLEVVVCWMELEFFKEKERRAVMRERLGGRKARGA